MSDENAGSNRPLLRIVRGNPTAEEIAAIVAVVSTLGSAPEPEPEAPSRWSAPAAGHRTAINPSAPGAWWASGLAR